MTVLDETVADALLVHLRQLLQAEISRQPAPAAALPDVAVGGLFVTIYDEDGEVRGSRGTTAPHAGLPALLADCARMAAFDDPRFPPLDAEALRRGRLAVTVLAPPSRIAGPDGIEPGITALRVTSGLFSGTTLPEVGWGRGWDAAVYLAFACRKAGVHAHAWQEPATEVLAYRTVRAAESW
jgi:uncharacterized protein (TIGR00296 family)